jgi:hypothetical protein
VQRGTAQTVLHPFCSCRVKEKRTADVLFTRAVRSRPSLPLFLPLLMLSVFARTAALSIPLFSPPHPFLDPLFFPFLHSLSRTSPSANSARASRRAKPGPVSPRLGRCNLVRRETAVLSLLLLLFTSPSLYSLSLLLVHSQNNTLHHHPHNRQAYEAPPPSLRLRPRWHTLPRNRHTSTSRLSCCPRTRQARSRSSP